MNEERQLLEKEIPKHISTSNQDILRLPKPQQEIFVLRASSPDTVLRTSQDVNA